MIITRNSWVKLAVVLAVEERFPTVDFPTSRSAAGAENSLSSHRFMEVRIQFVSLMHLLLGQTKRSMGGMAAGVDRAA
ncbi:hypothetical protein FOQG_19236 [Fusarium oxysporum f. sp. raphani 54005]|uniref:Uncharacterized protein n=1 Tax=Fusarium oxysporum f. sp. raphani 54005 TaxID=1089458 RepID=X0BZN9_FUSOX|nr:hypothetical protein FOQG_19236 [Fusarium oxysporum f. sp. raphani 54005]